MIPVLQAGGCAQGQVPASSIRTTPPWIYPCRTGCMTCHLCTPRQAAFRPRKASLLSIAPSQLHHPTHMWHMGSTCMGDIRVMGVMADTVILLHLLDQLLMEPRPHLCHTMVHRHHQSTKYTTACAICKYPTTMLQSFCLHTYTAMQKAEHLPCLACLQLSQSAHRQQLAPGLSAAIICLRAPLQWISCSNM